MKLKTNIYGLEIDIKAKGLYNDKRYNKKDTQAFLNYLCVILNKAITLDEMNGLNGLNGQTQKFHDILYNTLAEQGYYHID